MRQRNKKNRKTTCCKCNKEIEESRKGKYGYCKSCHAESMRRTRPIHSKLKDDARKKINARAYLHVYVKRGIVTKLPCKICGNPDTQAHHNDYSKPLEVEWFCRSHHLEFHGYPQKII